MTRRHRHSSEGLATDTWTKTTQGQDDQRRKGPGPPRAQIGGWTIRLKMRLQFTKRQIRKMPRPSLWSPLNVSRTRLGPWRQLHAVPGVHASHRSGIPHPPNSS